MNRALAEIAGVVSIACAPSGTIAPQQSVHAPARPTAVRWRKIELDTAFRSEGVAVADVNHDGRLDVLAGEIWYEAPSWTRHEIATPGVYDPTSGYSDCFLAGADDVNGDGWVDFLSVGFPGGEARWYENPHAGGVHWTKHVIAPEVCNESASFVDVDGDGRLDLVMGIESAQIVAWLERGADPTQPWIVHPISTPGEPGFQRFYHGLGFGDVDGDGRRDVLTPDGWYQAPLDPHTTPWTFHAVNWMGNGPTGPQPAAEMYAYDFDGDGKNDVVTSSPHAYGVWWWRQASSTSSFEEHLIDDTFSESHSLVLADVDGDGLDDLITGKRWYAHGPSGDPGALDPVLLVWYRATRTGGTAAFKRHVIDVDSGVGTQFVAVDVDGDGRLDVVTSNKKGVQVLVQLRP
jgi:hypothetical protein